MPMRAGLYKEPIEVLKNVITKNEFGEDASEWVSMCKTRARLIHDGGTRAIENNGIFHNYTKTINIHSYVDVGDYDRIKWNGRHYQIQDIEPSDDKSYKTIRMEVIND